MWRDVFSRLLSSLALRPSVAPSHPVSFRRLYAILGLFVSAGCSASALFLFVLLPGVHKTRSSLHQPRLRRYCPLIRRCYGPFYSLDAEGKPLVFRRAVRSPERLEVVRPAYLPAPFPTPTARPLPPLPAPRQASVVSESRPPDRPAMPPASSRCRCLIVASFHVLALNSLEGLGA